MYSTDYSRFDNVSEASGDDDGESAWSTCSDSEEGSEEGSDGGSTWTGDLPTAADSAAALDLPEPTESEREAIVAAARARVDNLDSDGGIESSDGADALTTTDVIQAALARLPDAVTAMVCAFLPCARCGAPCGDGRCRVPHPVHLRLHLGDSMGGLGGGPIGPTTRFGCEACGGEYTMASRTFFGTYRYVSGREFCYEAPDHTLEPVCTGDERRVVQDVVGIVAKGDVQAKIDSLAGRDSVRVVKVHSEGTDLLNIAKYSGFSTLRFAVRHGVPFPCPHELTCLWPLGIARSPRDAPARQR